MEFTIKIRNTRILALWIRICSYLCAALLLCLCYEFHAFSNTRNYNSPCLYNTDKIM